MKKTNYQKQVDQEKYDRINSPSNGKRGMDSIKRHLWTHGIRAKDVSTLHTGYDLFVDNFFRVECKSSRKESGYMIYDLSIMKFDVLAVALFEELSGKYKVYYLKNKEDLVNIGKVKGEVIEQIYINREKLEMYFTTRPKEVFAEYNKN